MKAKFNLPTNNISAKFDMNVTPDIRTFATKAELQIETDNRISGDNQLGNRINLAEESIYDLSVTVNNNYAVLDNKFTSIYETITNYGDIVSYNATDFATAAQGALASTAIQPNDNITLLNNNAGFITNAVNDLTNYYLKSETYTKTEVQQLIASIPKFTVLVVQELPLTGQPMTLYLLPKDGEAPDVYEEYIWVTSTSSYELIGSTAVDLDGYATENWVEAKGYATETFVNTGLATKQNTLTAGNNITISGNTISATDTTYTAGTGIDITNGVISNTQTSAEWGNIEGDILEQTDLIGFLDTKQDLMTSENAGNNIEIANGSGEAVTVSGNGSLLLEDAEADSLNSVTLTGGTTLNIEIPSDYTRIEFLEATGTQYIDSDVVANFATNKIKQTATVQYTTSNTSRELMGTNGYGFWGKNASNKIEAALGSVTVNENALNKNVISWTTNPDGNVLVLKVNDNQYTSTASSFVDASYAYYVFALGIRVGSGAAASFLCHAKVWDYIIEVDDVVVCHLIPVRRNSDNVLGMYDVVTGTFKTNAGTGTFTAGPDVILPSPSNPVDLITNNGVITVSPNLFRTLGTTTTQGGVTFTPQSDGSVICSGTATGYYSYYLGRADFDPGTIDKITVSINGTFNASGNIVVDKFHVYSGSTSLGTISYTNWTQYLTVDIANDYPTADNIRVYLKRNSNTDTNATIQPMAVKGATNKSWKPYGKIYITGTTETVTDEEGNTATAENLLAMNDYADTQEVLTGVVNRQLGILALSGNESWNGSSSAGYFSLLKTNISPSPISTGVHCYCTHFVSDASGYANTAGKFWLGTSYLNINYNNQGGTSSSANMANFKNWLKSQYAAGTPVIIIYPLETETTETVTGQILTTVEGNNTLTITQASINNLPIEANYDKQGGLQISLQDDITINQLTIGNTTLNESQLQALLALL